MTGDEEKTTADMFRAAMRVFNEASERLADAREELGLARAKVDALETEHSRAVNEFYDLIAKVW